MADTGAYFSYTNLADYATLSAFNLQTYVAALPLTNLQDHRLSKKARTAGSLANGFSVGLDLTGGVFTVNTKIVALCGLNFIFNPPRELSNTLSVTINFSNVSIGSTDIGQYTFSSVSDNTPQGMPANIFVVVNGNSGFTARYISINFNWSSGSITYMEAGRLWIGDAIVQPLSIEEGWQQTIKDLSTIQRSRGGQIYADIKQRYRNTKLEIKQVPRASIYPLQGAPTLNFQEMFLNAGMSSEVIVIPRSNTGFNQQDCLVFQNHTGIYGVFAQNPSIVNLPGDLYNLSMEFDESL